MRFTFSIRISPYSVIFQSDDDERYGNEEENQGERRGDYVQGEYRLDRGRSGCYARHGLFDVESENEKSQQKSVPAILTRGKG